MAILRKADRKNFLLIDSEVIRNPALSLKSIGLMARLLDLPDNWEFSEMGLVSILSDGRTSIRSALKELEDNGYLKRERARTVNGQLKQAEWFISEKPMFGFPTLGKPTLGKPTLENSLQSNTNQLKTNISNTKRINTLSDLIENKFDEFWESYPRKVGKPQALKTFKNKVKGLSENKLTENVGQILKGLEKYKAFWKAKRTEINFIPHPSSWLNQERWKDELDNTLTSELGVTEDDYSEYET